jgi:CO/xanthine dehydrogenase FAD-binding subunit
LLLDLEVPPLAGGRATYLKLRRRGSFDFPVLGVAAWARLAPDGTVDDVRIVLGAVGSCPRVSEEAAALVKGQRLTDDILDAAARSAARPAKPLDNTDFTIGWRKDMVPVYVRRALAALK